MRLVLWDIDHTLIDTRGVGRELSAAAFQQTTGTAMREQARIDGITEAVIFRETAKLHHITTGRADFERFATALAQQHRTHTTALRTRGHVLPGASAALDALAARTGVTQTVVSGNIRPVAEIKLAVYGLDRHITWDVGAYGDDADERADLVGLALRRSGHTSGQTVLIGDTPADIEGGHAHGVRVIAVATGRSPVQALREAGADTVLTDLTDTPNLVRLVDETP
ncbi:haloacid dehalogenase-like hydrolase [Streptomyces sp. JV176]|uniref:HAD family hydrolase n=1 Tax=Streptomyces sp. JV176 TaxID=858630 RepID=UPI002E794779|nr:haloacid dehalogenase-like hydrolase [Streptomyces sp. JV176]MEE1798109.1 haloacid dehalogenase-like hydrolase [Streptomyces sp. JV176]